MPRTRFESNWKGRSHQGVIVETLILAGVEQERSSVANDQIHYSTDENRMVARVN